MPINSVNREDFFHELAKGMSQFPGKDRLEGFILNLGRFFEVAFLATVQEEKKIACLELKHCIYKVGSLELKNYPIQASICEQALKSGTLIIPKGASQLFPKDTLLNETNTDAAVIIPLNNSEGNPIGLLGILQKNEIADEELPLEVLSIFVEPASAEIERLNHQKELQEQRTLFEDLAQTIPGAIFQMRGTHSEKRMAVLSHGAEVLWNQPLETIQTAFSKDWKQVIQHSDLPSVEKYFAQSERAEAPLNALFRVAHKTPTTWIQVNAQYRKSGTGESVWTGVFTDVTELKNAQRDLEVSRKNADLQATVLDSINRHQTLMESADTLARGIESFWKNTHCLIKLPRHAEEPQYWSYPSLIKTTPTTALPRLPKILEASKRPACWILHEDSEWNPWLEVFKEHKWYHALSCPIIGILTPPGGFVILFFEKLPDLPTEKLLQSLRKFSYSASLVDRYAIRED